MLRPPPNLGRSTFLCVKKENDEMSLDDYKEFGYTPVNHKRPFLPSWQNNPLTYEISSYVGKHISVKYGSKTVPVLCTGFGLILGDGYVAVDFDGSEAFEYFFEQFGLVSNYKVNMAWTSGKESRMQFLWKVPSEYWDKLKTIKVGIGGKLEFRWKGAQSVMPPSLHSNEYGNYKWLIEPYGTKIYRIPDNILEWWIERSAGLVKEHGDFDKFNKQQVDDEIHFNKVVSLVSIIREFEPLKSRNDWSRVSWAVAHEIGVENAKHVMNEYYPEDRPGAYNNIFTSYKACASPKFGTLYFWANRCSKKKTANIIRQLFEEQNEKEERALSEFLREQRERRSQINKKGNDCE